MQRQMRIAVAPNAFRGSLSALQATNCIIAGLQQSALDAELLPMPLADGGDSTLDVLLSGLGGARIPITVTGAMGAPTSAVYGRTPDGQTGIVEMARGSGIEVIPRDQRNPLLATSTGTGELIRAAADAGCTRILIGMGGSATVDGGAGCLQALGVQLLDAYGQPIPRGGGGLSALARIDASAALAHLHGIELIVLADVTNRLLGEQGAARIFGPQKGATPEMVEILEANLAHLAAIIARDCGVDIRPLVSSGAAGGLGASMVGVLGARMEPGGKTIIATLGYEPALAGVDLIITGEGKLDAQTIGGKAVHSLAEVAARQQIPVIALVGTLDATQADLQQMGLQAAWSILPRPCSLDEALSTAGEWLTAAAQQVGNLLVLSSAPYPRADDRLSR